MAIFKRSGEPHALEVAMTGVQMGDRLLQVGCTDISLLVAIAKKVGLSGHVGAVAFSDEEAERTLYGAEREGILIELDKSPLGSFLYKEHAYTLVVIDNLQGLLSNATPAQRAAVLQCSQNALAPRGRIVVIERTPRGGVGAILQSNSVNPQYQAMGGTLTALKAEGFKAVRLLADRDGLSFFEGTV